MDSNDIYYSDNSQLIDSNNTEWINNTVLVENEDISWHDNGPEITVDYSESAANINNTLNNTDGYETADPGDNTETSQYFSMLESTITETSIDQTPKCILNVEIDKEETILPDIAANPESEIEELNLDDKISENEVILYRPAGSEELYAVQIAEDEHGNLQKYKFKVKQNEDGQFEAIPGTMEVEIANELSNEGENITNEANPDLENLTEQKENSMVLNNTSTENEETFEFMNEENDDTSDMEVEYLDSKNLSTDSVNNTSYEQDQDEEYQTVEGIHVTGDSDTNSRNDFEFSVSNINERTEEDSEDEYEVEELEEAFQDDEPYEDSGTHMDTEVKESHTTSVLQHKANISSNLKIPVLESENLKHNVTIYKDDKHLSYLVIKGKEKENVLLDRKTKFNTINMRSILKCNNPTFVPEKNPPTKVEKPQHSVPSIISNKDANVKNITKPKESKLEYASPVKTKSARQPRKQSLTPVNRVGSEIIVQPLVYPVNEIGEKISIPPSKQKRILPEVLQVSDDSDPEFVPKPQVKKKKRGRPRKNQNSVEITILDSDEEEKSESNSVIEVRSDQESKAETENEDEKSDEDSEDSTEIKSKVDKKPKAAEKVTKVQKNLRSSSPLKKNKCPLCPKTFPRALTLKRHINMHNVRKSLRFSNKQNALSTNADNKEDNSKQNEDAKVSEETPVKNKPLAYNCKKCKLKFLLESQYKRHQTVHVSKKPVGKISVINKKLSPRKKTIEKQVFSGSRSLRSSTKIPNNEKPVSLSEKKVKLTNATKNKFKCEFCGQSYSSRALLFSHRNTHKTFPCPNCKTTFTAKLLLDDHLRKNCVKSPVKALVRKSVVKKAIFNKPLVKCEKCNRSFPNQKSLQIHNSVSHRRRSFNSMPPPADISSREMSLHISHKMAHGGVPMSLKMQQAFDKMKQKT